MLTQRVSELSQETERLLQLALQSLDEAVLPLKSLSYSQEHAQEEHAFFISFLKYDEEDIKKHQRILKEALMSVMNYDVVLAIAATPNAKQSSLINAIVGADIFPDNMQSLNSLPTLIRHIPGQAHPVLHFPYSQPFDLLVSQLQSALMSVKISAGEKKRTRGSDIEKLRAFITQGHSFESRYEGAEAILECLTNLKNVIRLAAMIGIPFPFHDYITEAHLPVIDVAFMPLFGEINRSGQLTLLEMPALTNTVPADLQAIFDAQLSRASAVLVVTDTAAQDAVLHDTLLKAIQRVAITAPFTWLVDHRDQQADEQDDATQHKEVAVSDRSTAYSGSPDVFSVVIQWGYLAGRALSALSHDGHLPPSEQQPWVNDFTRAAFGDRGQDVAEQDNQALQCTAKSLWQASRLGLPVAMALHAAHTQASLNALQTASESLLNFADELQRDLAIHIQRHWQAHQTLQTEIWGLEAQKVAFLSTLKETTGMIEKQSRYAGEQVREQISHVERQLYQTVDRYFEEEQIALVTASSDWCMRREKGTGFSEGNTVFYLDNSGHAEALCRRIQSATEHILSTAESSLREAIRGLVCNLQFILSLCVQELLAQCDPKPDTCSMIERYPVMVLPLLEKLLTEQVDWVFEGMIEHRMRMPKKQRYSAQLVQWLFYRRGMDSEMLNGGYYRIDLARLKSRLIICIRQSVYRLLDSLPQQMSDAVSVAMAPIMDTVAHAQVTVCGQLGERLSVRRQQITAQQQQQHHLHSLMKTIRYIYEDSTLLSQDLQALSARRGQ